MSRGSAWHVVVWGGDVEGVANARRSYGRREGMLVVLRDANSGLSFGEATPLAGFGNDDLAAARCALESAALPVPVDDLTEVEALLSHITSASARFAVETALLGRIARRRQVSLSELLGASTTSVPRSVLVGALADDGFVEAARAAARRGARSVKLKAEGRDLSEESRRLSELRRALGSEVGVRLDLNGNLDRNGARAALAAYAHAKVELCEEPCAGEELLQLERTAVPWLADESAVGDAEFARFVAQPGCAGVVLKPTALGGLGSCLARARTLTDAGKIGLVSHAFEGPVALWACAQLALAVGGTRAHGLDRHAALRAFPDAKLPQLPHTGSPLSVVAAPGALALELEGPWTHSA
ncbi:MAG: hypothetical protein IPI67_26075 [Myxococcales bacterium]|nr:hypothetical protein [Myxococcales bacterium]